MINVEWLLKFDADAASAAFQRDVEIMVDDICQLIYHSAGDHLFGNYPEVKATLKTEMMRLVQDGLIEGKVSSDHWKAWLAEWGSGSLMDLDNPALEKYTMSKYFNQERLQHGMAIMGRDAGAYVGLDGETHESSGWMAGVNLEEWSQDPFVQEWMQKAGLPPDAFQPKAPLYFMSLAVKSNKNLIVRLINQLLDYFPFDKFFTDRG